jgi:hypothetical protein
MELYLYPYIRPHGMDTDNFNFFLPVIKEMLPESNRSASCSGRHYPWTSVSGWTTGTAGTSSDNEGHYLYITYCVEKSARVFRTELSIETRNGNEERKQSNQARKGS